MATRTLQKLRTRSKTRPAAIAGRLRKTSLYILAFSVTLSAAAIGMIVFRFWVPGLAWLQ